MELQHFSHPHPLSLLSTINPKIDNCSACEHRILRGSLIYGCSGCQFYLHKTCAALPRQIQLPFHPQHPLTLLNYSTKTFFCRACHNPSHAFTFHCSHCLIDLDIQCALLLLSDPDSGHRKKLLEPKIQHHSHPHPLITVQLCDTNNGSNNFFCSGCELPILQGTSMFVCPQCMFTVHKSCTELPRLIKHPFHPPHLLTLLTEVQGGGGGGYKCKGCCKSGCGRFSYNCCDCDFHLEIECASLKPTIRYESHQHLFAVFNKAYYDVGGGIQCSTCGDSCGAPFLRCVECDLNFHPKCIPKVPRFLNHDSHGHPLALVDPSSVHNDLQNPDDMFDEEDDGERAICNDCRKEINPNHCFYSCAKCNFVAHIDCILPQGMLMEDQSSSNPDKETTQEAESQFSTSTVVDNFVGGANGKTVDPNPVIMKLDGEIAKLRTEAAEVTAKLITLEAQRAAYHIIASNTGTFSSK